MDSDTQQRPGSTRRPVLPRRSGGDRKLAGVAGGLGRAFGIDPVLIRVAFVVLAIFGGSGVLLYCLGWLLMPADGDEVSAIEALAGRGQSSVSTALTIVLIIVGLSSAGSIFSWGLPFWPVVIAAIIVFVLVRHGQRNSCSRGAGPQGTDWDRRAGWDQRADWGQRAEMFAERAAAWGTRMGERADEWARRVGSDERFGGRRATGQPPASPFGRPAFWEGDDRGGDGTSGTAPGQDQAAGWSAPDPATRQSAGAPAAPDTPEAPAGSAAFQDFSASAAHAAHPDEQRPAAEPPSPEDLLTQGRSTPPSWDPLGVAPFAWDLPDPTAEPVPEPAGPARGRGVLGRLFLGLALITGGVLSGGVFAGWWALSWGAIAGITLAVLALGLLISSLAGRGGRGLIGPGIFLALVTLALTASGISGTTGYGQHTWTPATVADLQDSYHWNAGQATLDLSQLSIPKGQTVTTDLMLNGGQATILVPARVRVQATCSAGVGQVQCLDKHDNGIKPEAKGTRAGDGEHGTLEIEVRSNAGQAEVRSNG